MEDSLHFDIPVQQRRRAVRRVRAPQRAAERPERLSAEPINVYHWAAVALVTALMCVVMACAAGTPTLAHAAGFTSAVFGALGGALVLGGMLRAMRLRHSPKAMHSSDGNGNQR
jgi:predicted phage tail protein